MVHSSGGHFVLVSAFVHFVVGQHGHASVVDGVLNGVGGPIDTIIEFAIGVHDSGFSSAVRSSVKSVGRIHAFFSAPLQVVIPHGHAGIRDSFSHGSFSPVGETTFSFGIHQGSFGSQIFRDNEVSVGADIFLRAVVHKVVVRGHVVLREHSLQRGFIPSGVGFSRFQLSQFVSNIGRFIKPSGISHSILRRIKVKKFFANRRFIRRLPHANTGRPCRTGHGLGLVCGHPACPILRCNYLNIRHSRWPKVTLKVCGGYYSEITGSILAEFQFSSGQRPHAYPERPHFDEFWPKKLNAIGRLEALKRGYRAKKAINFKKIYGRSKKFSASPRQIRGAEREKGGSLRRIFLTKKYLSTKKYIIQSYTTFKEEEEEAKRMKARKKRADGRWSLKTRRSTRRSAGNWCQPRRIDVEKGLPAERPWNRSTVDSVTSVCMYSNFRGAVTPREEPSARESYTARRTPCWTPFCCTWRNTRTPPAHSKGRPRGESPCIRDVRMREVMACQ